MKNDCSRCGRPRPSNDEWTPLLDDRSKKRPDLCVYPADDECKRLEAASPCLACGSPLHKKYECPADPSRITLYRHYYNENVGQTRIWQFPVLRAVEAEPATEIVLNGHPCIVPAWAAEAILYAHAAGYPVTRDSEGSVRRLWDGVLHLSHERDGFQGRWQDNPSPEPYSACVGGSLAWSRGVDALSAVKKAIERAQTPIPPAHIEVK